MSALFSLKARVVERFPALRGISLARASLTDIGWYESCRAGVPVDRHRSPLPWIRYPAIHLLADRTPADARVFEFGAGNSTLWWAQRVAEVVSVEHDSEWSARVRSDAPLNVTVEHIALDDSTAYVDSPRRYGHFDVVVIDGRRRVECADRAAAAVNDRGIVVFDNSDRDRYDAGLAHLSSVGFRRLDLWGLAPGLDDWGATSIFYKDGNCLGL